MSDISKYVKIINEAYQGKTDMVEALDRGSIVKHKNGYATIGKVFDDGYMIKFHGDNSVQEVEFDEVELYDRKRDTKVGMTVKHKNGIATISKVFDDGYMIKFQDDGSTLEVEFDDIKPIK